MNKIAAYEIALERVELEKRAEYLIDTYGTSQGLMPAAYLEAFDRLEKSANMVQAVKNIGQVGKAAVTGQLGQNAKYLSRGALAVGGAAGLGTGFAAGRLSKR